VTRDLPRGEIRFRRRGQKSALRPRALVGIDRPKDTAERIRAALGPEIPLNPAREKLYIPPLESRDQSNAP
jgi:hypothetical protein